MQKRVVTEECVEIERKEKRKKKKFRDRNSLASRVKQYVWLYNTGHFLRRIRNNRKLVKPVTIIFALVLVLISYILHANGISEYLVCNKKIQEIYLLTRNNILEIYLAQLSLTFITTSVLSVLADTSVIIYWENVTKRRLIFPVWTSVYSLVLYAITSLFVGGIALYLGLYLLFLVAFIVDVISLTYLTFSVISVYFRDSEIKERLKMEFVLEASRYHTNHSGSKFEMICNDMIANVIRSIQSKDYNKIGEYLEFIGKYIWLFPSKSIELLFSEKEFEGYIDFLVYSTMEMKIYDNTNFYLLLDQMYVYDDENDEWIRREDEKKFVLILRKVEFANIIIGLANINIKQKIDLCKKLLMEAEFILYREHEFIINEYLEHVEDLLCHLSDDVVKTQNDEIREEYLKMFKYDYPRDNLRKCYLDMLSRHNKNDPYVIVVDDAKKKEEEELLTKILGDPWYM